MSIAKKGKSLSDEHRAKLSGRIFSPEHRAKLSAFNRTRTFSTETREKMSKAHKKPWSHKRRLALTL
jgi:hypothetical protein